MTAAHRIIKYIALALAAVLVVTVIGGIVGGLSLLNAVLGDDFITDMQDSVVDGTVNSLYVDIGAAEIKILSGDSFCVKSNLKDITVKNDGGTLNVIHKSRFNFSINDAVVEIYIPTGHIFDSITLLNGAGVLEAETLSADIVKIDSGAGKADINNIIAKQKCHIDTGAGKLTVNNADINCLDLDIGTGKIEFKGLLSGDCNIDMGIGAVDIRLLGGKDRYCFDVDKGIGDMIIDGTSVSDGQTVGNGNCHIDISGGIGSLDVSFE